MSAIKRYYEDVGYTIGGIIREDIPNWEKWFDENDEEGSLEDQVVTLLLTCQFDKLINTLKDTTKDLPVIPGRVLFIIKLLEEFKKSLERDLFDSLLKGDSNE